MSCSIWSKLLLNDIKNFKLIGINKEYAKYTPIAKRATQNIKMMVENATNVANNNFIIESPGKLYLISLK